jgi:hypothetical protein
MNILHTHERIVSDYEQYIDSFINIDDAGIRDVVETELKRGKLWPEKSSNASFPNQPN